MNIRISEISENDNIYRFTLSDVDLSIANALRRAIIMDIPCNVIRTEDSQVNTCVITKNTTRLHNEILKQRLSCIPIHMQPDELDVLPDNYILEVDVKNDTDSMIYVTTEHFRIKSKTKNTYITEKETRKIFPPDSKTGDYIIFARLRPSHSDVIPAEELSFTAEFSISTASVNSMFNVVSKCAYGNTPDLENIDKKWKSEEEKLKKDHTEEEIDKLKKNFYILDSQRIFKANSFDFVIQSVGVYDNKSIVKYAAKILEKRFALFTTNLDSGILEILHSSVSINHCFDIQLENEDYTIGNILLNLLYKQYYEGSKELTFCGLKKMHPHDSHSVLRMALKDNGDKNLIKEFLKNVSDQAQKSLKQLYEIL